MPKTERKHIALKEDFFSKPLFPLDQVRLMGTRCSDCEEVFLGKATACEHCQGENLESITLSKTGRLYSYTINWNSPQGDYKGPEPFQAFAVGLVELPEGIIILSVLAGCNFDELKVNMKLELSVEELYQDEEGDQVVTYKFRPPGA